MYIRRNEQQQIIAISKVMEADMTDYVADDSEELQVFLRTIKSHHQLTLEQSDQAMARVLEDVVNVLVDKGTIRFTDLPDAAQNKLLSRRELRGLRQGVNLLDDGDDLKL